MTADDPETSGDLARRQAELIAALVAGGPVPAGFDAAGVTATAHALLHKRADEVARRYPLLAHACGPDFTAVFVAWARTRPKTTTDADADAFAAQIGAGRVARRRWRHRIFGR